MRGEKTVVLRRLLRFWAEHRDYLTQDDLAELEKKGEEEVDEELITVLKETDEEE